MTDAPSILGLQRTTLRQQAVEALRRAITTGELEPGSHVSEIEMAGRLGISRGTLREAMRTLQIEGLLTAGTRGRLMVRHMSERELRDLFQVRAALEALAAATLAQRPDCGAVAEQLETLARRMTMPDASLGERMRPTSTSTSACAASPVTRRSSRHGRLWKGQSRCRSRSPDSIAPSRTWMPSVTSQSCAPSPLANPTRLRPPFEPTWTPPPRSSSARATGVRARRRPRLGSGRRRLSLARGPNPQRRCEDYRPGITDAPSGRARRRSPSRDRSIAR